MSSNSDYSPPATLLKDRPLRVTFAGRMVWLALAGGAPGVVATVWLLGRADISQPLYWTILAGIAAAWLGAAALLHERLTQSHRTISNILMAFREGDYSLRAARAHRDDPLGEILVELNLFAEALRSGRTQSVEASLLLDRVIASVDVAIFAFDAEARLRLANPAGNALLGNSDVALGKTAAALGLSECLNAENGATITLQRTAGPVRFSVRKGSFRSEGLPHTFLVLSNVSAALRQEEREAWRRLVRVLGHEINNSLSPIKSMAGALATIVRKDPLPKDWREDLEHALEVIESRADALRRFTLGYATLARLPEPRRSAIDFPALARRAAELEPRLPVQLQPGAATALSADPDQLEQVLINLLRNAADAALANSGEVTLTWRAEDAWFVVEVLDTGPGILNPDNLFVPFFTTKPAGTGIGLALCRQIAEAHGGSITLENRYDRPGSIARLRLPLDTSAPRGVLDSQP